MPHTVTSRDLDTENPIQVYVGVCRLRARTLPARTTPLVPLTMPRRRLLVPNRRRRTPLTRPQTPPPRPSTMCGAPHLAVPNFMHACMHVFSSHVRPLQHTFPQRAAWCDRECCHHDTRSLALLLRLTCLLATCPAQALSIPDKVRQLLFGIKTKAVQEADRQRRLSAEAQWRAEHGSKQVRFVSATCFCY